MAIVAQNGQQNDPNNQDQQNQQAGQPQTLAGSTQNTAPNSGRIASFSSGQQPQGSGRFTNLSKYMDANKNASENLGARAGGQFNREFTKGQTNVDKQNAQIAQGFQAGRNSLNQGAGYQGQLNQIGQGLNTFQAIDNRGDFDTAGQQAQALAKDTNYNTLASGNAVDQTGLQNQQTQALQASQNLFNTNQQNLQNLQTNQGRDQLLGTIIPKQGYSSGQRNFDKLFLTGNVLSGLQNNLSAKQGLAQNLLSSTGAQQGTLDTLTSDEAKIVGDLTKQARANQDLFNTKFGNMQNIADVNAARNARFNDLKNALSTGGAISQEDMALLGLNNIGNTFINENSPTLPGKTQVDGSGGKIGTYNLLKDPANVNKYISQGVDANSIQDITTQSDFDTYKALQNLALGRDTGLLSGVGNLGSSVNLVGDLAGDITKADEAFRNRYGNKEYISGSSLSGTEHANDVETYSTGNNGNVGDYGINRSVYQNPTFTNEYDQGQDINALLASEQAKQNAGLDAYREKLNRPKYNYATHTFSQPGNYNADTASAIARSNLANYLQGNQFDTAGTEDFRITGGNESDTRLGDRYLQNVAQNTANTGLTTRLEDILNTEGTRNAVSVGENKNYKRFGGLV